MRPAAPVIARSIMAAGLPVDAEGSDGNIATDKTILGGRESETREGPRKKTRLWQGR